MRRRRLDRRALVHLAGVAIGVAGLVFVVVRIRRDWAEIRDTLRSASVPWLLVATLCGLSAMVLIGVNWVTLLRRREPGPADRVTDASVPVARGLAWFFAGQLGKYVPGGIWPVVGQAELAGRGGVDRRPAYLATFSSMLFQLLAAIAVAAAAGTLSPNHRRLLALALGAGLAAVLAALVVAPLRAIVARVVASVTRGRLEVPGGALVLGCTVRHLPVWVLFASTNIAVHRALGGAPGFGLAVDLVFATTVAWMAGFVVVGVPGGIGVRESVFVALMTQPIGAAPALSIAVTARLVTIAVDLGGALLATTVARASRTGRPRSIPSGSDDGVVEAHHPDPVLQRGSDVAADGGRSPA